MTTVLSDKKIGAIFPHRAADSHKGDNGRLGIIGGSKQYFGAPILSGLAAYKSGVDLVYMLVPESNFSVTRGFYPDFVVSSWDSDSFDKKALANVSEVLSHCDCVLIGPGTVELHSGISTLLSKIDIPVVLDSIAIEILKWEGLKSGKFFGKKIVITPHLQELSKLLEKEIGNNPAERKKYAELAAKKFGVIVLLKGPKDVIAAPDGQISINETGNAGMTVGGTGDVLAGVLGSLIAQKIAPFDAAGLAAYVVGRAGDYLYKSKNVFFTASDVVGALPTVMAEYAVKGR